MKIGVVFGSPETTTGGNALKFYCSVRLDIRRSGAVKDGDQMIGNRRAVPALMVVRPSRFEASISKRESHFERAC